MDVNGIQIGTARSAVANGISQPSGTNNAVSPAGAQAPSPGKVPARDAVASVIVRQEFPRNTRLRLDEESNQIVAQFLDENNEVIRQVPPQELLDITARFNRLEGLLFDEQR